MATPKLLFLLLLFVLFLSSSTNSSQVPNSTSIEIACAAVRATLTEAKRVHEYMTTSLAKDDGGVGRQAVADCEDCFEEAVGELRDSVEELTRLEEETFGWQMSNVETWVSAALTNQVTCLDGLEGCKGRREL
ncbi:pectinesterase inhibitor 9-like [Typha angustifolia]|uniref:pectinesterase inhibitor 9-like n=1 Tax=Typha angustifolia TaxID=59011 RepID=UPI003C2C4085